MMVQPDGPDVDLVKPVPAAAGTDGYFRNASTLVSGEGTVVQGDLLNSWVESWRLLFIAFAVVPSKTVFTLLREMLRHVQVAIGGSVDTTSVTTPYDRTVIASSASRANGDNSACIASSGVSQAIGAQSMVAASQISSAEGADSFIVGCTTCTVEGIVSGIEASNRATIDVTATRSVIVASTAQVIGDVDNAGDQSAIFASEGHTADKTTIDTTSVQSMIAACEDTTIIGGENTAAIACKKVDLSVGDQSFAAACADDGTTNPIVTGFTAAAIAAKGGIVAGGNSTFIAGCTGGGGTVKTSGSQVAAIACGSGPVGTDELEVSGTQAAAMGVRGDAIIAGTDSVCLASNFDGAGFTATENQTVFGGKDATITWKIKSETGKMEMLELRMDNEDLTSAGPAGTDINLPLGIAAAQATWVLIDVGGTPTYIRGWQ